LRPKELVSRPFRSFAVLTSKPQCSAEEDGHVNANCSESGTRANVLWGSRGRRLAALLAVGVALALPAAGLAVDGEAQEDVSWNSITDPGDSGNDPDSSDRVPRLVSWNSASEVAESPAP
jgi:hypothetical protein